MARFDPVRSPVLDALIAHRLSVDPIERPPRAPRPAGWPRLAAVGVVALGVAFICRFPAWAILALPSAALASQSVRRLRWPFRAACSATLAAYSAQLVQVTLFTWPFRFAASFALFMAAALCWGLRMDGLD